MKSREAEEEKYDERMRRRSQGQTLRIQKKSTVTALIERYEMHLLSLLWGDATGDEEFMPFHELNSFDCEMLAQSSLLPVHPTNFISKLLTEDEMLAETEWDVRRAIHDVPYTHASLSLLQEPKMIAESIVQHFRPDNWDEHSSACGIVNEFIAQVTKCVSQCRSELANILRTLENSRQFLNKVGMDVGYNHAEGICSFSVSDEALSSYPSITRLIEKINAVDVSHGAITSTERLKPPLSLPPPLPPPLPSSPLSSSLGHQMTSRQAVLPPLPTSPPPPPPPQPPCLPCVTLLENNGDEDESDMSMSENEA